jgi:hypothetical protein
VTQPSSVTVFTIYSTDMMINQKASLSIYFATSQFKPKDAILEIIFPDDMSISEATLTSISGISKIPQIVNYSVTGQTVLMTNAISTYYSSTDFHFFKVSSVLNPVRKIFFYF